jgi:four helix bundle protein
MRADSELEAWACEVPVEITGDLLWRMTAYRLALYLADCAREDVAIIARDRRSRPHVDQLLHAVGSISANITEGYGRLGGADRARYFGYACASARESVGWYFKVRKSLPAAVVEARLGHLTRIVQMLSAAIPRIRARADATKPSPTERRMAQRPKGTRILDSAARPRPRTKTQDP